MKKETGINQQQIKVIKALTIALSILLFLASLTQNAYYLGQHEDSIGSFGLIAFLLGWIDVLGAGISWLANPFLILSWGILIFGSIKKSLVSSILALFFALSFMLFGEIIADEGGSHKHITAYDFGYYLWLLSCGVSFIGNLVLYLKKQHYIDS